MKKIITISLFLVACILLAGCTGNTLTGDDKKFVDIAKEFSAKAAPEMKTIGGAITANDWQTVKREAESFRTYTSGKQDELIALKVSPKFEPVMQTLKEALHEMERTMYYDAMSAKNHLENEDYTEAAQESIAHANEYSNLMQKATSQIKALI